MSTINLSLILLKTFIFIINCSTCYPHFIVAILGGLPEQFRPLILGIQGSKQTTTVKFVKRLLLQDNVKDIGVGIKPVSAFATSKPQSKGTGRGLGAMNAISMDMYVLFVHVKDIQSKVHQKLHKNQQVLVLRLCR